MNAYASYVITLCGNNPDIIAAAKMLNEVISNQDCFPNFLHRSARSTNPENTHSSSTVQEYFIVEKTHKCVWLEDILDLANNLAYYLPNTTFSISGRIEDFASHIVDMMDFKITYQNKKLTSQSTCWYIHIFMDDFVDYEAFCAAVCDLYGNPRYTEEDYKGFRDCAKEWYVLESGQGEFSTDVPFDDPVRIKIKRPKKSL